MPGKMKHIFCVDDDPDMLRLLDVALENMKDVKVHQFMSAYAAIQAMQDTRPDLVLLDVLMPDMNGVVAYKRMRTDKRLKDVKVVFVTARKSESDLEQYKALGVPAITKPINMMEFGPLVRGYL